MGGASPPILWQSEQSEQSEQYEQSEQREQYEQREQSEQYEQREQSEQSEQSEQYEQREQREQSEQYEQREQYEQYEQSEQFSQSLQFFSDASAACAASSLPKYLTLHRLLFESLNQTTPFGSVYFLIVMIFCPIMRLVARLSFLGNEFLGQPKRHVCTFRREQVH